MANQTPLDKKPIKDLLAEKDAFLTTSEKFYEYFLRHTKGIVMSAVAVALIVIGIAIYDNIRTSAEAKATADYEAALTLLNESQQNHTAASAAMEKIRAEHAGRKAARLAGYSLVSIYSRNGETDKAITIAEELLKTMPAAEQSLRPIALRNLGELYEVKKNYDLAVKSYETVLSSGALIPNLKLDVLMSLARTYAAAGKKDEAIKRYEQVVNEYPRDMKAFLANTKLAELKGRPVPMNLAAAPDFPGLADNETDTGNTSGAAEVKPAMEDDPDQAETSEPAQPE